MSHSNGFKSDDEAAVIGGMILDSNRIDDVVSTIGPADFCDDRLRELFVTLIDLGESGKPTNIQALVTELRAAGSYNRIGAGALAQLTTAIGSVSDVIYYSRRVRSASIVRSLRSLGHRLVTLNEQTNEPPQQILESVDCELMALRELDHSDNEKIVTVGEAVNAICDDIDAAAESGAVRGLRTGLKCFDRVNGGFQNGTLNVIAGRPSNGKSVLGLQFANSIGGGFEYGDWVNNSYVTTTQEPKPTLFCSLEMTTEELSARTLASAAEIDGRCINSYRVTADQRQSLRESAAALTGSQSYLWEPARATVSRIRAQARIHRRRHGLECLIVDYLQLVDSERGSRHDKETYRIGDICRHLKSLSKELSIPVVVLCQLNRDAEDKLPTMAHLADSGKIEQHADTITAVHRMRDESTDAILRIMKWRNGQTRDVDIMFDRPHCRFVDADE